MVGYDGPLSNAAYHQFVAGATAGFLSRLILQPFDVIKIRFQLQVEPISKRHYGAKYTGIGQAFASVVREEGGLALWKGQVPAQLLSVVYGTVQFPAFECADKFLSENFNLEGKVRHTMSGSVAGVAAILSAHPFDVIRTRLVAQSEPKMYTSIVQSFRHLVKTESPLALYRGLLPSLIQTIPYAGAQFGFNRLSNELWVAAGLSTSATRPDHMQSFICGGFAGVSSKCLVYPLDVVKKRLQLRGFEHARTSFGETATYSGVFDCIRTILKTESFAGLYKGLCPSMLKAGLASAFNFAFYEFILRQLKALSAD